MESVSCHQKGLVMGNILWSVDKKIYSDKEDHTLAITGWAITRDQSECDFILYGSGKELSVPEPSRCERADVAKDLKETMVKLIKYMRRFYVPIVMVIIFAIASTVFNIVGPTILGDATTEIFKGLVHKVSGGSGIDFDKVTHILLMLLSLYVASAIFSFIQGLIMTHVSNNVSYQMRKDISEKIHRMPMKYFESRTKSYSSISFRFWQ